MNFALEKVVDLIGQTGWFAIVAGVVTFLILGRTRLSTVLVCGLAIVLSFIYVVMSTKGTDTQFGSDEQLLMIRAIAALAYATFLVVIYRLAQAKFRPARPAPGKKPIAKLKAR